MIGDATYGWGHIAGRFNIDGEGAAEGRKAVADGNSHDGAPGRIVGGPVGERGGRAGTGVSHRGWRREESRIAVRGGNAQGL